jgi:solute carrier family 13 (sodium-dependent dicarboxylate transporter), member 2/3/5
MKKICPLLLGPLVFLSLLSIEPPQLFNQNQWYLLCILCWMIIWWATEAVALAVTALMPIVLFPSFSLLTEEQVSINYSKPIVFLFMGGFFIAKAIEKCGLHHRLALNILKHSCSSLKTLFLGVMLSTAIMSMFISNTATTIMMFTIVISIIDFIKKNSPTNKDDIEKIGANLMLAVAYSASIGGVGTLIGTPPNLFLANYLQDRHNIKIGMLEWMKYGLPFVIFMLPSSWLWLTRTIKKQDTKLITNLKNKITSDINNLGRLNRKQIFVSLIFTLAVVLWFSKIYINNSKILGFNLSDTTVAIGCSLLLFCIPHQIKKTTYLLTWQDALKIPWGILLLFGAGLSISAAFKATQLDLAIAGKLTIFSNLNPILLIIILTATSLFLTEISSNLASIATLLPIVSAIALTSKLEVIQMLIPVTLASSCAFMLPIATPPNAIVFSYDKLSIKHMIRNGFFLNILALVTVVSIIKIIH